MLVALLLCGLHQAVDVVGDATFNRRADGDGLDAVEPGVALVAGFKKRGSDDARLAVCVGGHDALIRGVDHCAV